MGIFLPVNTSLYNPYLLSIYTYLIPPAGFHQGHVPLTVSVVSQQPHCSAYVRVADHKCHSTTMDP